jgi:hypothetical protein
MFVAGACRMGEAVFRVGYDVADRIAFIARPAGRCFCMKRLMPNREGPQSGPVAGRESGEIRRRALTQLGS